MEKRQFVKKLGELIRQSEPEVDDIFLKDEETVVITFVNGFKKQVDIACDSNMAILADVARGIMY